MTASHDVEPSDGEWLELTGRAAFASHRLIGWIYWDPVAIERYTALGPEQWSYYVASRGASLADAGNQAVAASFYSIHPGFIAMSLDNARASTTFDHVAAARDAGVGAGLRELTPDICDELAAMSTDLWAAADALPMSGRVLAASLRERARPDDPLLSARLGFDARDANGTSFRDQATHDVAGPRGPRTGTAGYAGGFLRTTGTGRPSAAHRSSTICLHPRKNPNIFLEPTPRSSLVPP